MFGIAFLGLAVADEARPGKQRERGASKLENCASDTPWLGLSVGRLDDAVRAHVPDLPKGFGFVVTDVAADGPAAESGVKPYDILWKLDDQLIANEAQLLSLLRLKKEGEEVALGLHRSGEKLSVSVVLGTHPSASGEGEKAATKPADPQEAPMKVLNPAGRSAKIDTADGEAVLFIVNDEPEVRIVSADGSVIYEGPVRDPNGKVLVPDQWDSRVGALERALAHAMKTRRTAPAVE